MKVATTGLWEPNSFYVGDKLTGMFIELINGFCEYAGYTPKIESMSFAAEMTGLSSGAYDILADTVELKMDRADNICVTDQLLSGEVYLVVREDGNKSEVSKASVFLNNIKGSIKRTIIDEDRYKMLLSGLGVTVALSLIAGVAGTLLGAFVCFLRMSKSSIAQAVASLYIRLFRGLPIVVVLMVMNYVIFNNTYNPIILDSDWIFSFLPVPGILLPTLSLIYSYRHCGSVTIQLQL